MPDYGAKPGVPRSSREHWSMDQGDTVIKPKTNPKPKKQIVYVLTDTTPEGELVILSVHKTRSGVERRIAELVDADPDELSADTFGVDEFEVRP